MKTRASFFVRIAAFLIDVPTIITIHFIVLFVFNYFYPAARVQFQFMSSMSEESQWWFLAKSLFFVGEIFAYHTLLPLSHLKGTLGHLALRIRLVKPDGSAPGWRQFLGRALVLVLQWVLILFPGPIIARFGGDAGLTLMNLLLSLAILTVTSMVSWKEPQVNIWDRIGGYRFISIN